MKTAVQTLILSCIILFISAGVTNSQTLSCCQKSVTAEFAMLGADEAFKAEHLAPLPFHFVSVRGKMVAVKSPDGKDAAGYEIKSLTPTKNYLLVFQEWWGLNDYIKQEAVSLAEELGNVNVIALDLYDGKVATTPEEAGMIMKATKEDRMRAIIKAFIKYAGPEANIQTIGWCFGGGWSLQASMMAGKNAGGCVMYYGMPENNQEKLRAINFPILGIFATRDGNITPEVVSQFEANMKALDKPLTVRSYDADHAFANPSNPKFNKEATEDAHGLAVGFLRSHLK